MTAEDRQRASDDIRRRVLDVAREWHADDTKIDELFSRAERLPLPDGQLFYRRALSRMRSKRTGTKG